MPGVSQSPRSVTLVDHGPVRHDGVRLASLLCLNLLGPVTWPWLALVEFSVLVMMLGRRPRPPDTSACSSQIVQGMHRVESVGGSTELEIFRVD